MNIQLDSISVRFWSPKRGIRKVKRKSVSIFAELKLLSGQKLMVEVGVNLLRYIVSDFINTS